MKRDRNDPCPKEAADWILTAQERPLTRRERRQLAQWLRSSPANVREYLDSAAVWNDLAGIDQNRRIDVDALASHDGVVPLPVAFDAPTTSTARRALTARISAIAAAVLVFVAAVLYWQMDEGDPRTVSTALGEQRSVALADGSIVHLNTQSQVRIDYDKRRRFLELVQGEALFTAVEDPARLFIVQVGEAEVRVAGTQFNIRRRQNSAVVTVVAGTVRVGQVATSTSVEGPPDRFGDEPADGVVEVVAGQRVGIDHAGLPGSPEDVHAKGVLTWTERRLVFDGDPLSVIAEEFNRYNAIKLKIGDSELGDLPLSGVFSANDPASLVEYLQSVKAPTVDVRRSGTALILHSASD